MFQLTIFTVVSIIFAVVGMRLVGRVKRRIGEAMVGLSLLTGIFGAHAYHWNENEITSANLSAALLVVKHRLEDGEIGEVLNILDYGVAGFMIQRADLIKNVDDFWRYSILHKN